MEKILRKDKTLDMSVDEFRNAAYLLIDRISAFMEELPERKVTSGYSPSVVRSLLPDHSLPLEGQHTMDLLNESANLLFEHSLFNGHPRFWGYITSSAAPIGTLAEMIASTVNANVGAFTLSPMATEIERQTVQWLGQLVGYNDNCGGLFVSGGNMANFLGFLAARKNRLQDNIRQDGLPTEGVTQQPVPWGVYKTNHDPVRVKKRHTIYCAKGTHTWISKAAEMFGHGTDSIRWIDVTPSQQIDLSHLIEEIENDVIIGHRPFLVVANAGYVSTGVVDPLREISAICKAKNLWFHIDGAYGGPAAALPEMADTFKGLKYADSIALDPHKWLYSPLEAGCVLVKRQKHLREAFNFNPDYYNFNGDKLDQPLNYHEYGMQNSRGFRALKVWLTMKQVGKNGLVNMIRKDIQLAQSLFLLIKETPNLEAVTQNLSITTFRYVETLLSVKDHAAYWNMVNEKLLNRLQAGGEVFLSNAIINGDYCLRVCIVNFRTTFADLEALIRIVLKEGKSIREDLMKEIA